MRTRSMFSVLAAMSTLAMLGTRSPAASSSRRVWLPRKIGRVLRPEGGFPGGHTILLNDRGVVGASAPAEHRLYADSAPLLWDGRELPPRRFVPNRPAMGVTALGLTNGLSPVLLFEYNTTFAHIAAWDGTRGVELFPGAPTRVWMLHVRRAVMNDSRVVLAEGDQGEFQDPIGAGWDPNTRKLDVLWDGTTGDFYPDAINGAGASIYWGNHGLTFREPDGTEHPLSHGGMLNDGSPPMVVNGPPERYPGAADVWTVAGGVQPLAFVPGEPVSVQGVNDRGEVLFTRHPMCAPSRAMLWSDDNGDHVPQPEEMRDLTPAGFTGSTGLFLNQRGGVLLSGLHTDGSATRLLVGGGEATPIRFSLPAGSGQPHVEAFNSLDQLVITVGKGGSPIAYRLDPFPP